MMINRCHHSAVFIRTCSPLAVTLLLHPLPTAAADSTSLSRIIITFQLRKRRVVHKTVILMTTLASCAHPVLITHHI